ncbi:MAG: efflux RND transporter periplasmic adaptor subunit [Armatimonadia bacterium]
MSRWIRRYRYPFLALLLIVTLLAIRAVRGRLPEVEVAQARFGSLTSPIAASGLVEAQAADVGFKKTGRLIRLYVSEGDHVQRDQHLARIFPSASLSPAADDVGEVIQAPWDGFVVVIYLHPGAVVNPGQAVLRLVEAGTQWVTVFVEPEDAAHMQPGQRLSARAGGYLSEPQPIIVTRIGKEAVPRPDLPVSSRQVRVQCKPTSLSFSLPPGTEVDVDGEIPLLSRGLLIPTDAVVHRGADNFVWVVRPDHTVTRRMVSIGPNNFDLIAITSGLEADTEVVVNGKEGLREGRRVRTRPMSPPEAGRDE